MNKIQDYLKTKLKGNVHSVKINYDSIMELIYIYNREGLETEHLCFKDGIISSKRFIIKHQEGIDVMSEDFLEGKSVGSYLLWRFDNQNNLVYDGGDHLIYDTNGHVYKKTRIDIHNNLEKTKLYEYDDKGNKIKKISYDANDQLYFVAKWKYNNAGEVEEYQSFDNMGVSNEHFIYTYDEKGQEINEISFWHENEIEETNSYKYDVEGNLILHKCWNERLGDYTEFNYFYQFDSHKNIIYKCVTTENQEPFYENTYEYDFNNNLIRKVKLKHNSGSPELPIIESYDIKYF